MPVPSRVYIGNLPTGWSVETFRPMLGERDAGLVRLCLLDASADEPNGGAVLEFFSREQATTAIMALRRIDPRLLVHALPASEIQSTVVVLGLVLGEWYRLVLKEIAFLGRFIIRLVKDIGIFLLLWESLDRVEGMTHGGTGYAGRILTLIHESSIVASYIVLALLVVRDVWRMGFREEH